MTNEIELMLSPESAPSDAADSAPSGSAPPPASMEDELVLEARQKITLRCGKASITLYPNGKIALRGEYIVSDAAGVNRIAGGQVELN
ncbi:hypothetical protein [Trinickia acidisoli]|uniref:hypothetical protein n=1 Tax=Trinickia acidisoli TaxID=2767482 RepID=UPI001A8D9529|nr:hypothetical protein [Trinickia acidisoli]